MAVRLSSPTETLSGSVSARLTPARATQLAECILAGRTRQEMAQLLGIAPRTASRWKKNPLVVTEVERIRNRSDEQRAAEILVRLTESDDERVALRACELVLQR